MRARIKPYNPRTSAKMRIRIMPTKIRASLQYARTPASPTTPIAYPAARPLNPTLSPAPKWLSDLKRPDKKTQFVYFSNV